MKYIVPLFILLFANVLSSQNAGTNQNRKTNSKISLKSINASFLSVGYSSDHDLSAKWTLGWSINVGPDLGYFHPFNQKFKEDSRPGVIPFLRGDVNVKYKLARNLKIEFGLGYAPFTLFNVAFLDGLAGGNFKGVYLQPWFGKKIQIGWRLSLGKSHIDGNDYTSYNSYGIYSSTLLFKVLLNPKKRFEQISYQILIIKT